MLLHSSVALLLLSSPLAVHGLYSKDSAVLQVTAKTYDRLINKSNYTSIVEFYAPWCGHCKNLAPAFQKAASSLKGIAKVAAVDCDSDSNKALCGEMGVEGFPTLKIVKPSKKAGGKPSVEDYNGPRTAKAINDAVTDKISNHVTRLTEEQLDRWLEKNADRPKALFISDKGFASPLVRALAIDFLGSLSVGYVKSSEKGIMEKYGVPSAPAVVLVPVSEEPIKYNADMSKAGLLKFFSTVATPNPDAGLEPPKESAKKPSSKSAEQKPKETKIKPEPEMPAGHPAAASPGASCPMGKKANADAKTETLEDNSNPTESPDPKVDAEKPAHIRDPYIKSAFTIPSLVDEASLQKSCLHSKASTCILAFLPTEVNSKGGDNTETVTNLSEISKKHKARGAKMFPFYSMPSTNVGAGKLAKALGMQESPPGQGDLIAINAKRGWWVKYDGQAFGLNALETWIDRIRFQEITKEKIPAGVIEEIEKEQAKEDAKEAEAIKEEQQESPKADDHDEL